MDDHVEPERKPTRLSNHYRCVHCSSQVPQLLVKLGTSEYALQTCSQCNQLADTYIETDYLLIFVDLLLAKKSAYVHLLYNMSKGDRYFMKLAFIVLLANAYLIWSRAVLMSTDEAAKTPFALLGRTLLADIAMHLGTFLICTALGGARSHSSKDTRSNGWLMISEALFLSSITRLFFMSLTLIWPHTLSSATFELAIAYLAPKTVKIDSVLFAGLDLLNRSTALSAVMDSELSSWLVGTLSMGTGLLFVDQST